MNQYIEKVKGPVIPLPTPFNEDESLDLKALHSYVSFLANEGIPNVMTTVGTSRFNLLSADEIMKVNETVVDAAKGKAITIVANPPFGSQKEAMRFAKHSKEIGADIYLAYYPERHYGDHYIFDFFKSISDNVDIPILIHEMPMRNGLGAGSVQYSLNLLKQLLTLENVIGMKEEALDVEYSNELVKNLSDEAVIIGAGGGMSRYLRDHPLGAKAYLGGIGNFYPKIEIDFYDAITNNNLAEAESIVKDQEMKYFEKVVPMGWHPSLKAALAAKNFMQVYERKPFKQTTDKEVDQIKSILEQFGWK